jgi:hypothetical protein
MFVSPLFGVLAAFAADRVWEKRRLRQRVKKVLPHVYFEMALNLYLAKQCLRNSPQGFVKEQKRFDTTQWNLFKEDLAKWSPVSVLSMARVYSHLENANRLLSNGASPRDGNVNNSVNIAEQLISELLVSLESYFAKDRKAKVELEVARKEWKRAARYDPDLKATDETGQK